MKKKINTLTTIIIIIIIIIIFGICLLLYFLNRKKINKSTSSLILPPIINSLTQAKWYNNSFPEENYLTQPSKGFKKTGIAFSGGGTRAACTTWGFLQALNSYKMPNGNSLLHIDNISYISANSGSTWMTLPLLYEPTEGSIYKVDDILGNYVSDPSQLNYSDNINFPNFGYNAVNCIFDLEFDDNWWSYSVGNSFFKKYGLYQGSNTNGIVGYNSKIVDPIVNGLGSSIYKGIVLRANMPIPIAIESLIIDKDTVVPIDSTPISSGFLRNSNTVGNINQLGGRVDSYAFNTFLNKINTIDINTQNIMVDYRNTKNTWDPVIMSGTSSSAYGMELLQLDLPNTFPFIGSFTSNIKDVNNLNIKDEKFKIIDGYLWDDTGVISLVARKTEKIASIISCSLNDITVDIYTNTNYTYLFVIDGQYINNIGKFNSFDTTTNPQTVSLTINNSTNNPINVIIPINFVKVLNIGSISNLFGKGSNKNIQQIFKDEDYYNTLSGLLQNYASTGIFYYRNTYTTMENINVNVTSYSVDILWYCLSPCTNFYSKLSVNNKNLVSNMYKIPNVCTFFPYYSDCNGGGCDKMCKNGIQDILTNLQQVQKISNAEAKYISSLSAWVCYQIIIPFLTDSQFPEQKYSLYTPQIIIKPILPPSDEQQDIILNVLKTVMNAIDNANKNLKYPDYSQILNINKIIRIHFLYFYIYSGTLTAYVSQLFIDKDKTTVEYSKSKIKISSSLTGSGKHEGGKILLRDITSKDLWQSKPTPLITLDNIKIQCSFNTELDISDENNLLNIDFSTSNYTIDNFSIINISDIVDIIWNFMYSLPGWDYRLKSIFSLVSIDFIKEYLKKYYIIPAIETNLLTFIQKYLTDNKSQILNIIFPDGNSKISIPIDCKYCIFPDKPPYTTSKPVIPNPTPYPSIWDEQHTQELENFIDLHYINSPTYVDVIDRIVCISDYIQKTYTYDYFIKNKDLIKSEIDNIFNTSCNLPPETTPIPFVSTIPPISTIHPKSTHPISTKPPCIPKCISPLCGQSNTCGGICDNTTLYDNQIYWIINFGKTGMNASYLTTLFTQKFGPIPNNGTLSYQNKIILKLDFPNPPTNKYDDVNITNNNLPIFGPRINGKFKFDKTTNIYTYEFDNTITLIPCTCINNSLCPIPS